MAKSRLVSVCVQTWDIQFFWYFILRGLFWVAVPLPYIDFGVYRLPLANREYIRTAGLRSTVAWAMASLAEISVSEYSWQRCRALHKGGLLLGRAEAGVLEQCGDFHALCVHPHG